MSAETKEYLSRIEELKQQLAQAQQMLFATKAGEADDLNNKITENVSAHSKVADSEKRYNMMLMQSPFAFAIFTGRDLIITLANDRMKEVLGKGSNIENLPLLTVLPELAGQPFPGYMHQVMETGKPFYANEALAKLHRNGKIEDAYFNFVYQPYWEVDGSISGITCIAYEVTNEVIAKKRINESEQNLRNTVLTAPVGMCVLNAETLVSEIVNDSFVEIAGKPYEAIMGHYYWDTFAEAAVYFEASLKSVVDTGIPFYANEIELMLIRHGEEEIIYVTFVYMPMKNSEGKVIKVVVWVLENTQQVHARRKVEKSEKEYRELSATLEQKVTARTAELQKEKELSETIVNTSTNLISVYAADTSVISFNHACLKFLNFKIEDVIGKQYLGLFPASKGSQGHKDLLRALKGEYIHNDNFHSVTTGRYYQNSVTPLKDENGKVYAAVAISHDITELLESTEKIKQSEEKFNTLFQLSPLALALNEFPSGIFVGVNEAYENLLEFTNEDLTGKSNAQLDIIDNNERQKIIKQLSETQTYKNVEVILKTKSRREVPVLASSQVIEIGNKKFYLNAITDITTRKKSELEIEQANNELKKMNEELASFAYVSSHDLQEPLRKIQAFSNRILIEQGEAFNDKTKDNFTRIVNASERMQHLIDALLNYSRTNTSAKIFTEKDLNQLLEEVTVSLEDTIAEKKAIITSSHLPTLKVISHQFYQLLSNLISNSLKYSKADVPPVIEIKAEKISAAEIKHLPEANQKEYWKITVTDNGIGFEQEYENRIFQLFQRLHGKNEYSGTGIGLAICKKIVENHHGIITATGEPGKGATFTIYLPISN